MWGIIRQNCRLRPGSCSCYTVTHIRMQSCLWSGRSVRSYRDETRTGTVCVPVVLRLENISALFGLLTMVYLIVLSENQSGVFTWGWDSGRLWIWSSAFPDVHLAALCGDRDKRKLCPCFGEIQIHLANCI